MGFEIRRAGARDSEALAALALETFVDTFGHLYGKDDLEVFLAESYNARKVAAEIGDPDALMLVAEAEGVLIGYVYAASMALPHDTGGRTTRELKRLYLREDAKGTGLAQNLTDAVVTWANDHGAQDLYLGVYADNHRAQAFYRRNGFEIVGQYFFMVGKTADDERIMVKRLG